MRPKHTIRIFLLAIAIGGSFLVLRSSSSDKKADSCKESLQDCSKKEEKGSKMIWENLSHQFFSSL